MITTNKIQLTTTSYFKTIMKIFIKKWLWFIVVSWSLAVFISLKEEKNSFLNIYIIFALLYPFIVVIQYWIYAHSKDNRIFLLERYFEIYEDKVVGFLIDGTENTVKNEHFIRVVELSNNYLLYISKNQYLLFPKDCFKSDADMAWFEEKIILNIKR